MTDESDEVKIVIGPNAAEQMKDDPELAEFIKDMNARLRQAMEGVDMEDPVAVSRAMHSLGFTQVNDIEELVEIDTLDAPLEPKKLQ